MNLSELQIEPILRNKWEAMDVGVRMAAHWYKPMFLAWFIPALICLILFSAIFYEDPWIGITITWWLKPLFDRLPLYMISRYLFNEPAYHQLTKKALWRLYTFDLLAVLTWRRFEPGRSFNLAINVLELQKGAARSRRRNILAMGCGNAAGWLTITMLHIEALLSFGFLALLGMLIPENIDLNLFERLMEQPLIFEYLYNLIYFCAMCAVAPFYIASGFSLYINRRIELEAWDIELQFRHSMEKRAAKANKKKKLSHDKQPITPLLLLVLTISGVFGYSDISQAAQTDEVWVYQAPESDRTDSKEEILSTLESPPFVIEREVTNWEWKTDGVEDSGDLNLPEWLKSLDGLDGLENALTNISSLFEILVWLFFGLLAFLLIQSLKDNFDHSNLPPLKSVTKPRKAPEVIMGLEVTRESLPDDISSSVKTALAEHDTRLALSLLYRFSLHKLIHEHNAPLASWHTEQECADIIEAGDIPNISYLFNELTLTWQLQAYAHKAPSDSTVLALCDQLLEAFES